MGSWVITAFEATWANYIADQEARILSAVERKKKRSEGVKGPNSNADYGREAFSPSNGAKSSLSQNNKGDYYPTLKTIVRWASADASTLLHETGHCFLDMRVNLAASLEGKENLTEGEKHFLGASKRALRWLGVDSIEQWNKMGLEEKRPIHEKFARTNEAYLMTGQAPTKGLRKVFRAFSRFLKKVYYVITAIPEADLSPEAKAVFDQLFISQEQIAEAKMRANMYDIFNSFSTSAGIDFMNEYQRLVGERDDAAEEYLLSRLMKDLARRDRLKLREVKKLNKTASEFREKIRAQETEAFNKSRVGLAMAKIKNGAEVNGEVIRPRPSVADYKSYGVSDEDIERLKKLRLVKTSTKGVKHATPDELAEGLGYTSGSELVQELISNIDPNAEIDARTELRMAQEHSDLATPKAINRLADEAVANEAGAQVLATEIAALEKRAKSARARNAIRHLKLEAEGAELLREAEGVIKYCRKGLR